MNKLILFFAAALAATAAFAQPAPQPAPQPPASRGHLEPEDGFFADYQSTVREVLKEAFAPGVRLRVVVEPSFEPEFALGLRDRDGGYELFYLMPSGQVWDYALLDMMKKGQLSMSSDGGTTKDQIRRLERQLKTQPKDLKIERCTMPVETALAERMIGVWQRQLQGVRPKDDDGMGIDGEFYHFSMPLDGKELQGQIWSPALATDPGKLVDAVYAMRDWCKTGDASHLATVQQRITELSAVPSSK